MAKLRPFTSFAAVALLLLAQGCAGESDGEAAIAADLPADSAAPATEPGENDPRLPLPRPEGERAIGARIWEYQIELTQDTVSAGEIEFHVVNAGTDEHWLIVRDDTLFEGTPHLVPGDSAVLRVTLGPGEYNVVCTIRDEFDHISEGERRRLIVIQ